MTLIFCIILSSFIAGCGAINLKTGTKRKTKDPGGSSSPKIRSNPLAISLAVDTTGGIVNTPTPHHTSSSMLSPGLENGSSNDSKKRKKARTTFTGKQIYELERQFEIKKYLSSSERSEMARLLNVTEVQVRKGKFMCHICLNFNFQPTNPLLCV